MKCPKCVEEGRTSKLKTYATRVTATTTEYFYDEEGKYHYHDVDKRKTSVECSNGHVGVLQYYSPCWCGYNAEHKDVLVERR